MPWVTVFYFSNICTNEPAGSAVCPIAFWTRVPSLSSAILFAIVDEVINQNLVLGILFLISRHSIVCVFFFNVCLFSIYIFNFSYFFKNIKYSLYSALDKSKWLNLSESVANICSFKLFLCALF